MRKKQSGATLVNVALAIVVLTILLITTVTQVKKIAVNLTYKQELKLFVNDALTASNIHFFNEVNSNGSCFTFIPSPTFGSTLMSLGFLDPKYSSQRFFNPALTRITYRSGSTSGLVDTIDLVVPLNETATQNYHELPYFTFGDDDEVRFSRKIEYNQSESLLINLDKNFCHG